jgi:hypothetical protein
MTGNTYISYLKISNYNKENTFMVAFLKEGAQV